MKAFLEITKLNLADVLTASTEAPCGNEYTPELPAGCDSGIPEDE